MCIDQLSMGMTSPVDFYFLNLIVRTAELELRLGDELLSLRESSGKRKTYESEKPIVFNTKYKIIEFFRITSQRRTKKITE